VFNLLELPAVLCDTGVLIGIARPRRARGIKDFLEHVASTGANGNWGTGFPVKDRNLARR
jgi:hypothetical protein